MDVIVSIFAIFVMALVAWISGYVAGHEQAKKPLTELKPLRFDGAYRVDAVLGNAGFRRIYLVVSWYVDWGHYEQRIARLNEDLFTAPPTVGAEIHVRPLTGTMRYVTLNRVAA